MWWVLWLTCLILILLIVIYHAFLILEQLTLFVPVDNYIWLPEESYQSLTFPVKSHEGYHHRLHAWYFNEVSIASKEKRPPIVLFCHGNTGNISHRKYVVDLCHEMHLSLFLFDYRGYGQSSGQTTLSSLKEDGEAAYQEIRRLGYQPHEIIVWGESLGGLVASHIATQHNVYRLLLMATFSDLASLAVETLGPLGKITYFFLSLQAESNLERIKTITIPTLIIHSEEDEIIPYHHATLLYNAIGHPWKSLLTVKGGHGTPRLTKNTIEEMMRFCWQEPYVSDKCEDVLTYIAETKVKHGS